MILLIRDILVIINRSFFSFPISNSSSSSINPLFKLCFLCPSFSSMLTSHSPHAFRPGLGQEILTGMSESRLITPFLPTAPRSGRSPFTTFPAEVTNHTSTGAKQVMQMKAGGDPGQRESESSACAATSKLLRVVAM